MIFWIGMGGVIGALSRYFAGVWLSGRLFKHVPFPTLFVNAAGSFLLSVIYAWHVRQAIPSYLWHFLGIGFCGSFTTFSTFGYETMRLVEEKKRKAALLYVTASVAFGLAAAWIGMTIAA